MRLFGAASWIRFGQSSLSLPSCHCDLHPHQHRCSLCTPKPLRRKPPLNSMSSSSKLFTVIKSSSCISFPWDVALSSPPQSWSSNPVCRSGSPSFESPSNLHRPTVLHRTVVHFSLALLEDWSSLQVLLTLYPQPSPPSLT